MRSATAPYTHTHTSASASTKASTSSTVEAETSTVTSPTDDRAGNMREAHLLFEALRQKLVASHSSIILTIEDALVTIT